VAYKFATVAGLLALAVISISARAAEAPAGPVPAYDQSAIARRGYFYVPGSYIGEPGKQRMHEQMYVEVLTPRRPRSRYPLVLIHGAAQTATNWMGTPDGRPGWADYFVGQGYTVYMVDQPARGRSPWLPEVDGKLATFTAEQIESRFTAPARPLMSGNGDADMVRTNTLACGSNFLLRLAVCQSKDLITETGLAAISGSRFRRGGASVPA